MLYKTLFSKTFRTERDLTAFVNEEKISDIQQIVVTAGGCYDLFYWQKTDADRYREIQDSEAEMKRASASADA